MRLVEPGVDLAVALAVASAVTDHPIAGEVVMGEIGLGGEVRQVAHAKRRLGEAVRIGLPAGRSCPASSPACDGIELVRVRTVSDALAAIGIGPPASGATCRR